ncbi:hypothetical protein ABEB36_005822 [Hypothenemus hampei]|uniref:Uncharacterized protein n=1 Tax=Hypothenemus hampei TaxID=57062 RepID=A0ABD1F3D2_HYPHA
MGTRWFLVLFTVFYQCSFVVQGKILVNQPDFVKTCMITKPREEFRNCSTNSVQTLFYEIPKGNEDIGLQVLDPLKVPVVKILQGGGGPVAVNASLTDVTVIGFGNTKIVMNFVDPETYDFYTKLHLPRMRIDGKYELLGRILVIPLRGKGSCWFDAKDLDIHVKSDVQMREQDGFHFFNVTAVHVKFTVGGLKLHMGNLFDGIKALGTKPYM